MALQAASGFGEAAVLAIANHQVIKDVNAEEHARGPQPLRERYIVRARRRIAARVVVYVMCPRSLCGGDVDRVGFSKSSFGQVGT
jgi:hypothetical protein